MVTNNSQDKDKSIAREGGGRVEGGGKEEKERSVQGWWEGKGRRGQSWNGGREGTERSVLQW